MKRKVSRTARRLFVVTAAATAALATLAACSASPETTSATSATGAAAARPGAVALPSPKADAPKADAPVEVAQGLADAMQNLRDEARNRAAMASDDIGGAQAVADVDDDEPEASAERTPAAESPAAEPAPAREAGDRAPAEQPAPASEAPAPASEAPAPAVEIIEPEVVAPAPSEPALPAAPAASEPPAPPAGGVDCSVSKCIALTFDDGPSKYTPGVLDTLKARNAKATFFVLGQAVERNPNTARRIVNEGSEIAVHTWNHPQLSKIGAAKVEWQLTSTRDAIQRATGVTPAWMRPPYGDIGGSARKATARVGYPVALWNVDTLDWQNRSAATTKRRALAGAKPGAIILMHDIHPYAPQMLPELIDELQGRGYHLVTMSELMRGKNVQPGVSYTRR